MLTNQPLAYYNHLLATTVLYFSLVDPLQELTNNLEGAPKRLTLFVLANLNDNQDYYQILGVSKDATKQEIHKAFRQLAKKYHPDKNEEKGAQDEFIKVFKAYETLSDEKKRKEYDGERSRPSSQGFHPNGGHPYGMNDFDMNKFFKQYEDQLFKHAHHFGHHQSNHHQRNPHHDHFSFHGVNLDDLFHDIDEDEFQSFGRMFDHTSHNHADFMDGAFGDGASFFGSHFPSQVHHTIHQQGFHASSGSRKAGEYSCQTITRQVNGMMMTQTSCA